jgi:hypothetical protein
MAYRWVRGDRSFLRLLKLMPPSIRAEVNTRLNTLGDQLLAIQRSSGRFKDYSGPGRGDPGLRQALSKRVTPMTMRLKVGLVGKPINRQLFYGLFIEKGRKAGGRGVKRGSPKYNQGVGRMSPDPFIRTGQAVNLIGHSYETFRGYWDSVLQRAGAGTLSDE